jgi:hypothetical protein
MLGWQMQRDASTFRSILSWSVDAGRVPHPHAAVRGSFFDGHAWTSMQHAGTSYCSAFTCRSVRLETDSSQSLLHLAWPRFKALRQSHREV